MDRLRVSASDIDAYRYFREHEDADLGELIARLRRLAPPTDSMLAGTAMHAALEASEPGDYATLSADGFTFEMNFDGELDLPAIREMKATEEYLIDDCVVTLVGKVDAIHGLRVDDHKFTAKYDPERFLDSYQWRIYLQLFDADEFRWNIFEGRETAPRRYVIRAFHQLRMHRYPGMADDIDTELHKFVAMARTQLPDRFNQPVPHRAPAGPTTLLAMHP